MLLSNDSPSRRTGRASGMTAAVFACVMVLVCGSARADFDKRSAGPLAETDVAFTVHNPGVPGDATIRGTLIRPAKAARRSGTAVILLHGAVSDGTSWMGPLEGIPSMAHKIARAGHSVFAIDRLGYGRSAYQPFPGAGWTVTTNTHVETLHEVVAQVRGGGAGRVVLVGLSLGAGTAQAYATRYHDVDGVVSMAWSNQPPGDAIDQIYARFVLPQFFMGHDYAYFFPPGDGFAEECVWLFHAAGADPAVMAAACADGFLGTSPSGELATVADLSAEVIAGVGGVTTPVLLVYAEFDNFFPGPEYRGLFGADDDTVTPDVRMWRESSQAAVDVLIVPDTGHAIPLHDSANGVAKAVVEWIGGL